LRFRTGRPRAAIGKPDPDITGSTGCDRIEIQIVPAISTKSVDNSVENLGELRRRIVLAKEFLMIA
jgi:hypothetical protein